ncbi:MAG: hypothetical protein ACTSR9_02445 [Candidatus Thorarchaeota archaeon]
MRIDSARCLVFLAVTLLIISPSFIGTSPNIEPTANSLTDHDHKQCITINESDTPSADSPTLTWTSRTESATGPEPEPVSNQSSLIGDHIVLNATFPEELNVTRCEMRVWNGFTYTTTRPLVISTDPDGVFEGIIDPAQFDWVVISGLETGLTVNITCNFTASDCDFMVWPESMDQSEYTYANNVVNMVSGDKPEHDEITWREDGTLTIGCLDYCGEEGNWNLHLQVGADWSVSGNESSITIDTYYMDRVNQMYSVQATGYTDSNKSYVIMREDVRICNFFAPEVIIHSLIVNTTSYIVNISWSSFDANSDDVNYYSLWVSTTDGLSYMLMAQNLTITTYCWDYDGWPEDDYIFRVRAYSLDFSVQGKADVSDPPTGYWPGDYGDGFSSLVPLGSWGWGNFSPRNIGVRTVSDITFSQGAPGYAINWDFYNVRISSCFSPGPTRIEYYIYKNDILFANRNIAIDYCSSSATISISLDDLETGTYNYTVYFENPGSAGGFVRDVVIVTVTPDNTLLYSFINTVVITFVVITIPGMLIVFIVLVRRGFDRNIIKRSS